MDDDHDNHRDDQKIIDYLLPTVISVACSVWSSSLRAACAGASRPRMARKRDALTRDPLFGHRPAVSHKLRVHTGERQQASTLKRMITSAIKDQRDESMRMCKLTFST